MGLACGLPIDLTTGLFVNYYENKNGYTRAYASDLNKFGLYFAHNIEDYRNIQFVFADNGEKTQLDADALMLRFFELKLFRHFSDRIVMCNAVNDIENHLASICFYFNSNPDAVREHFDCILAFFGRME